MRVLFPFQGNTIGGSKLSGLLLAEGLNQLGVQTIIAIHQKGILCDEVERRGLNWTMAPPLASGRLSYKRPGEYVRNAFRIWRLVRFLKNCNIDIVHANDPGMDDGWGLPAKLSGAKFVWHQRQFFKEHKFERILRWADAQLTISELCRSSCPPAVASKVEVLDNPFNVAVDEINREISRKALCAELGISNDTAIIGFVSNFYERKRPLFFLDIAAQLCEHLNQPVCFPMFGATHPSGGRVEERIKKLGLENRCRIMGARFPIEPHIAGLDVLVAPAVQEPFGRTLVESMLVGTPVVAADDGGHVEIIDNRDTGILAHPDDAMVFADSVAWLIKNPEDAKRMADRAKENALQRFSVRRHAAQVKKIYDRLMR